MNTTFDIEDEKKKEEEGRVRINITFDIDDAKARSPTLFRKSNRTEAFEKEDHVFKCEIHENVANLSTVDDESSEVSPAIPSYSRQITYTVPQHNSYINTASYHKTRHNISQHNKNSFTNIRSDYNQLRDKTFLSLKPHEKNCLETWFPS